jgi:uncharacterized cupin superfamily protein
VKVQSVIGGALGTKKISRGIAILHPGEVGVSPQHAQQKQFPILKVGEVNQVLAQAAVRATAPTLRC